MVRFMVWACEMRAEQKVDLPAPAGPVGGRESKEIRYTYRSTGGLGESVPVTNTAYLMAAASCSCYKS